jgi:hypothetical protein
MARSIRVQGRQVYAPRKSVINHLPRCAACRSTQARTPLARWHAVGHVVRRVQDCAPRIHPDRLHSHHVSASVQAVGGGEGVCDVACRCCMRNVLVR